MDKAINILTNYLRCASISADPAYAQGVAAAREYVAQLLRGGGFAVEIVPTPLHAIVFAQRLGDPSWPHVVLYGHYDVQPVDPLALWDSDPFEPVERDGRIYARGATDQKGPFVTMFTGLMDAIEAAQGGLKLNVTVIVEGEEEIGSPSFRGFLKEYAPRLSQADCVILSDTISPSPEQIAIATGLRGLVALEVLFEGPSKDVHSGFYGGAVANPLHALMAVGASLHDASGRVTVPGFYEKVKFPQAWEREELKRYPMTLAELQEIVGSTALAPTPAPFESPLEMLRFAPTLEFNGLGGGYQGPGSKTIIPARAQAKITCRLVPDQDPKTIAEAVRQTIQARCPQGIRCSVHYGEGGLPYRVTPPQGLEQPKTVLDKAFIAAQSAIEQAFGKKPVFLPEGGSIPIIADLKAFAGLDSLMIGLALPQDNMHSPNESYCKKNLERGAQAYSMLFKKLAES